MASDGHPLYSYRPTKAGAIIFVLLFMATTGTHLWQMIRRRSWFMTALVIGGLFEFIGYVCRAKSSTQPFNHYTLMPYAIQNTYLLIAPILFAASIYMVLSRIVLLTDGEARSPVSRRRLTKSFVLGDVFCLLVQCGGGSLSTVAALGSIKGNSSPFMANAGKGLTIVGLVAQLFVFAGFIIIAALFHKRMVARPTAASLEPDVALCWKKCINALYIASALVMVRNFVRVVEYCQGLHGYIIMHEAFLYVFDALLMFAVLVLLNLVHPGELGVLLRQKGRNVQQDSNEGPLGSNEQGRAGKSMPMATRAV